jgi:predicted dehydrogenase
MIKKINFGIIGVGGRGGFFAKTCVQDEHKRGDIIALCDTNPIAIERYDEYVEQYLGHKCKHYSDYREMIDNPDVDAVVIGTPDQFHHEMALYAFKANKHVYCEKPVGINLQQMVEIVQAAKDSGKILEIGYVLRYAPFFVKIKEILESNQIGRPLSVDVRETYYGGAGVFFRNWWRFKKNNGGIMVQKICHDLDLIYWMFGKPKRIVAFESNMEFKPGNWDSDAAFCTECDNKCPYVKRRNDDLHQLDQCIYNTDKSGADIVDNAKILIQFENDLNLTLTMNFFPSQAQNGREWRIIGSQAELTGKLDEQLIRIDPRHDLSKAQSYYIESAGIDAGGHGGGDDHQVFELLDAISENRESKAGIESAYWSSILVMGAQISADTHQVVEIVDLIRKYPYPK